MISGKCAETSPRLSGSFLRGAQLFTETQKKEEYYERHDY